MRKSKAASDSKITDIKAPAADDPRWAKWSAPLFSFLTEPRSWSQLAEWQRETQTNGSLLRHCLAWLENMGYARSLTYDAIDNNCPTSKRNLIFWVSNVEQDTPLWRELAGQRTVKSRVQGRKESSP